MRNINSVPENNYIFFHKYYINYEFIVHSYCLKEEIDSRFREEMTNTIDPPDSYFELLSIHHQSINSLKLHNNFI